MVKFIVLAKQYFSIGFEDPPMIKSVTLNGDCNK